MASSHYSPLEYLARRVGRAPELKHVPAELVGQAEDADDDWVGGVLRATARGQAAQPEDALARCSH